MKQQIKVKTEWSLDGHVGTIKTDVAGQVTRKVIDLQDQAMAEMLNAAGWYKREEPTAPNLAGYKDPVVCNSSEAKHLWDSGEYDGWTFNYLEKGWGLVPSTGEAEWHPDCTYALYKKEVKPQKTTIEDLYNEEKGQFAWLYRKNGFIEQANPELYDGEWEMSEEKTISDLANAGVRYTFNPFLSYEEATPIT